MRGLALAAAAWVAACARPASGVTVGQQPGVESVAIPDGAVALQARTGMNERLAPTQSVACWPFSTAPDPTC
jgi:hypothetical protein